MTTATTQTLLTQNWAILATEAAAIFLVLVLLIGVFCWLDQRKRIKAARALLDNRADLAKNATETFQTHIQALAADKTLSPDNLGDYEQRSLQLVNELVAPWLEPSADRLTEAVRQIMTIRHNDLHQIAAIFRHQPSTETTDHSATASQIQQLQTELAASQKAEAECSTQLAEALKSVSIIASEYGRKFGIEADYHVPQILRALIYLQSIDKGMGQQEAIHAADASMESTIQILAEEFEADGQTRTGTASMAPAPPTNPQPGSAVTAMDSEPLRQSSPAGFTDTEKAPSDDAKATNRVTSGTADEMTDLPKDSVTEAQDHASSNPDTAGSQTIHQESSKASDLAKANRNRNSAETASADSDGEENHATEEEQIDLDAIELPEHPENTAELNLDLDDIDALLDAEINRQKQEAANSPPRLSDLNDDELDLSKKPSGNAD